METDRSIHTPPTWARCAWLAPLVLSLFACGGGGGGGADAGPGAAPAGAPAMSVPQALQGQWDVILTYVPAFYSGPYGDIPPGDGSMGISFVFAADGSYRHLWTLSTAYFGGNCFRTAQWDEVGTISAAGTETVFTAGHAIYVNTDTCGKNQYLDPAPTSPGRHTLRLDKDPTGWPLLHISFPTGDLVLEKCRRCQ